MLSEYLQEFAAEQQDHIRYNTEVLKARLSRVSGKTWIRYDPLGLGFCSDCEVPRVSICSEYAQHDIDAASTSNQTCQVLPVQSAESRFELQLSGTGTAAICGGEDHRSCELQEPVSHIISNHFNSCHASTYLFRNLFIYFNFNNFSPAVSSDPMDMVSCTWSPMDSHGLHMSAYFCRSNALPLPRAGIGHWIFLATQRGRKGGRQRLD